MHILIVDQCCKQKDFPDDCSEFDQKVIDQTSREDLINRPDSCGIPANDLYQGRQQQAISRAVNTLRANGHSVVRLFVSAGFGIVQESTPLPPYNVTFQGMGKSAIRDRADKLQIRADLARILSDIEQPDVAFLPLGSDYLEAIDLERVLEALPDTTNVVLFNQESRTEGEEFLLSLSARNPDASQYGVNAIELKGHYIEKFASRVANEGPPDDPEDLVSYCRDELTSQTGFDRFS
jgi:hypothetical protein